MDLTHFARDGIMLGLILISLCISCLGEVPEDPGQIHIDPLTNSLAENIGEALPETSSLSLLEEDIRELYSSEILLENQSRMIASSDSFFSGDKESIGRDVFSLSAYEGRLRDRAVRLAKFERRLKEIWPEMRLEERVYVIKRLEGLLRHQAAHIDCFQSKLKNKYCLFPIREKKKFLNSLEDLLDREANLLLGFEDFLHHLQNASQEDQIEFLASFEDLIRSQARLLEIYEQFLKVKCNILKINKYVDSQGCYRFCRNATYTYMIRNTCNCSIDSIKIIDSRLGIIVEGASLGPYEKKSFNKSTILDYPPGTVVCNTARAWGIDPNGFRIMGESNEVCIRMPAPARQEDSLQLGNQKAFAIASDGATAENNIVIEKNQLEECCANKDSYNQMAISAGDQLASAYGGSKGANNVRIISDQQ